ncbi:MAG: radical SAM protein [Patescibacteria group bacterium]
MEETMLIGSLPAVVLGDKIIVFSPYTSLIAAFPLRQDKADIQKEVKALGMAGEPGSLSLVDDSIGKIIICTTYDCNLRCRYCFVSAGEKEPSVLDSRAIGRSIARLAQTGIKQLKVHFFGGEPTMNFSAIESTVALLDKSLSIEAEYEVTTNGLVSPKHLDFMMDRDFVFSVSLDGMRDIHDFHRPTANGRGSFEQVVATVDLLVKKSQPFRVRTTITSFSVSRMPEIVNFFADLGIEIIHFEAFVPFGRGSRFQEFRPEPKLYADKFIEAMDEAAKRSVKITEFSLFQLFNPLAQKCFSMYKRRFVLLPDGKITFCLGAQSDRSDLSNLFYIGGYNAERDEVFLDETKIDKLRHSFSVDSIEKCRDCFAKYICCGICPAHNVIISGDPRKVDEFGCLVRRRLIKEAIIRIWKQSEQ